MLPSEAFKVMTSEIEGEIAKRVGLEPELPTPFTDTDRLEAVASRRLHLRPPGDHDPLWIAYEGVYYADSLEWKGETFRDAIDAAIRGAKS